ncbi:MAG: hypothetical protein QXR44_06560 [Thermoproteota archaeon]
MDSGATYTLLQNSVWKRLDITPKRSVDLTLADGLLLLVSSLRP